MPDRLPDFPNLRLRVVEDITPAGLSDTGFLRLRRRILELTYADGSISEPFVYDETTRSALDAVVMAAYFFQDETPMVYLRSCFRPPAALRHRDVWPIPEKNTLGHLWELPAGLVEPHERSELGLRQAAAREIEEELGFVVTAEQIETLGPGTFSVPGMCAERIFYYCVKVDPKQRKEPTEDGSPLERGALIEAISLQDAIKLTRTGDIEDMKTEITLKRLADKLGGGL